MALMLFWDIFSGGSETSATVVDWAMAEMIKNPAVMAKAQAEVRDAFQGKGNVDETGIRQLKYLNSVIKETLRLHPVFPLLLPRECSQNCKVNGFEIPSKTRVIINAWAIGRDPNHWVEPEKFDPERFTNSSVDFMGTDFEFIPFGGGRRICPGILFALPNVELPLAQLLFHFDWKLPSGTKEEDLDMTEEFGMSVRRKNELVLVSAPYNASITVA
ncbi:cytochrome P450 71D11-like [Hibiscus syriacus]|uniref:Cytochrome P450 71D11-like n=1 Tax=Hibiscus syriacus TaxID=106335 RepID=A0A6A2ZPB8_HIBSY|nr:cytochrome P450 71D11-like [Hibiscus syriacus]